MKRRKKIIGKERREGKETRERGGKKEQDEGEEGDRIWEKGGDGDRE